MPRPTPIRPKDAALREAIRRAGGTRSLGRKLGISMQAVIRWDRAPPLRVLEIERVTGVSRYKLRPDVFGSDPLKKGMAP